MVPKRRADLFRVSVKFHLLTPEHLEECAELLVSVFANPPWNEAWTPALALKRLQNFHHTPESYGVLAQAEDSIVGFALGHIEQYAQYKTFCLNEICVDSRHQRSGLGTALMDRLQADLANEGIVRIWLLTLHESPAESFYKKYGFCVNPKIVLMAKSVLRAASTGAS